MLQQLQALQVRVKSVNYVIYLRTYVMLFDVVGAYFAK